MGAFYLLDCHPRVRAPQALARARDRLREAFRLQGFGVPTVIRAGHAELALYPKLHAPLDTPGTGAGTAPVPGGPGLPSSVRSSTGSSVQCSLPLTPGEHDVSDDFTAFTGTVLLDDLTGADAALAWRQALERGAMRADTEPDWARFAGNFCAIARCGEILHLFVDPLGVYKVYHDLDRGVFASSMLAVAATVETVHADTQGVYEYVFHEACYGGATPLAEVREADALGCYSLGRKGTSFSRWPARDLGELRHDPLEAEVTPLVDRLRDVFGRMVRAFPGRIDTALSGGYDSRLAYALLVDAGATPDVHVYGRPGDDDVRVARTIAGAEGIDLDHTDKGQTPDPDPSRFAEVLERNFQVFDGAPPSGVFDGGADLASRAKRCADGSLLLNGGGGEVFRNFFYLAGGAMNSQSLVSAFYNRYDPASTTARFDDVAYRSAFARNIEQAVGAHGSRLTRAEVEYAYPAFRCRFWMGRNNAVNNRLGFALTPFVELPMALRAAGIALRHKNHGRLEAAMIHAVSPALAAYPSAYGHAFDVPPPASRVRSGWMTMLRPAALRRYTYRLRHRRMLPRKAVLGPEYLAQVVDPGLPHMAHFFKPDRLYDPEAFGRACTLEYLFERLAVLVRS